MLASQHEFSKHQYTKLAVRSVKPSYVVLVTKTLQNTIESCFPFDVSDGRCGIIVSNTDHSFLFFIALIDGIIIQ